MDVDQIDLVLQDVGIQDLAQWGRCGINDVVRVEDRMGGFHVCHALRLHFI